MKARTTLVAAALVAMIVLPSSAQATGGGTFWLFSDPNQQGCWRAFDIAPDRLIEFGGLKYQSSGCTLWPMDNSVESVQFSCGQTGTPIDDNDWIEFFDLTGANGDHQTMNPIYPSECVNGNIRRNLNSLLDGRAGSLVTNE